MSGCHVSRRQCGFPRASPTRRFLSFTGHLSHRPKLSLTSAIRTVGTIHAAPPPRRTMIRSATRLPGMRKTRQLIVEALIVVTRATEQTFGALTSSTLSAIVTASCSEWRIADIGKQSERFRLPRRSRYRHRNVDVIPVLARVIALDHATHCDNKPVHSTSQYMGYVGSERSAVTMREQTAQIRVRGR